MKALTAILVCSSFAATGPKPFAPAVPCEQLLSAKIPPVAAETKQQPAKYRFTTEYTMLGPQGAETGTHVVVGEFTANAQDIQWTSVTVGQAGGHAQSPTSPERQRYMEGLRYARYDSQKTTSAELFRDFPPAAIDERNLVWDELMFDSFVHNNLEKLRLNEPILAQSGDVQLGGSGKFTNRRIELTWMGVGRRNGEDCLLVHYEALLNRFSVNAGQMTVNGGSDYVGDIWVSIRTHQIEYGTLLEEVAGVVANAPGSPGPQPFHVLRTATLVHV